MAATPETWTGTSIAPEGRSLQSPTRKRWVSGKRKASGVPKGRPTAAGLSDRPSLCRPQRSFWGRGGEGAPQMACAGPRMGIAEPRGRRLDGPWHSVCSPQRRRIGRDSLRVVGAVVSVACFCRKQAEPALGSCYVANLLRPRLRRSRATSQSSTSAGYTGTGTLHPTVLSEKRGLCGCGAPGLARVTGLSQTVGRSVGATPGAPRPQVFQG